MAKESNSKDYECILYEVRDSVGKITFNLPQYNNALNFQGVKETLDALIKAEDDPNVGCVMLTGTGKAFCSGFNLKEIPPVKKISDDIKEIRAHFRHLALWWHQIFHRIVRMPKPILSAVNGPAAGSGLGLALTADMVVASEKASFLCAWHTIGLANDATTSYTLVKIVGFRRATELMYTNRTLTAKEANDWQIVNAVYSEEDFKTKAWEVAKQLAAAPTHLQGMAKESFHMGWRRSLEEATEFEIQNVMKSVEHPYFLEALEKFQNKKSKSNVEQIILPIGQ
jgi:2-(1,2-epoxy-1,2-dihydrophenyl)acetyl-CoA isomerase